MAEEIHFKISHFRNFEGPVTLTLISDDLEIHIVAHVLSTSTTITYWLVATSRLIVDGRMDGHVFTNSMNHLCSSAEMTKKGKLGEYAIKRVAAGPHLPTPWLLSLRNAQTIEPNEYCLGCKF